MADISNSLLLIFSAKAHWPEDTNMNHINDNAGVHLSNHMQIKGKGAAAKPKAPPQKKSATSAAAKSAAAKSTTAAARQAQVQCHVPLKVQYLPAKAVRNHPSLLPPCEELGWQMVLQP